MDILRDWVRDIFIIIIACYFIEIVLPLGNIRKYVRFVFSIMILGVVISPILSLDKSDVSAFTTSINVEEEALESLSSWEFDIESTQNIQIVSIYKEKLEEEVLRSINGMGLEISVISINTYIEENYESNDYGRVIGMNIVVDKEGNESEIKSILFQNFGLNNEINLEVIS